MKENELQAHNGHPAPKWAAIVTDTLFPMPRRNLVARDVLDQAEVGPDFVLVRDHDGPHDVVLGDDEIVDLSKGNVFNVITRCDVGGREASKEPAKLAYVCDDVWKVTVAAAQTLLDRIDIHVESPPSNTRTSPATAPASWHGSQSVAVA